MLLQQCVAFNLQKFHFIKNEISLISCVKHFNNMLCFFCFYQLKKHLKWHTIKVDEAVKLSFLTNIGTITDGDVIQVARKCKSE